VGEYCYSGDDRSTIGYFSATAAVFVWLSGIDTTSEF